MSIHHDKTQKGGNHVIGNGGTHERSNSESRTPFVDNRPKAVAQRNWQELLAHSPRIKQFKRFQELADNAINTNNGAQHSVSEQSQESQISHVESDSGTHLTLMSPIQFKERLTDDDIKKLLKDVISTEKGSCNSVTSNAYSIMNKEANSTGTVALLWVFKDEEEASDGHTALMVSWDDGVFVVDASIGQYDKSNENLFIGSVADWQSMIKEFNSGDSIIDYKLMIKTEGLIFTSPNSMAMAMLDHNNTVRAHLKYYEDIGEMWEESKVAIIPSKGKRQIKKPK